MSPLLMITRGPGKKVVDFLTTIFNLNYYGPGQCDYSKHEMSIYNKLCSYKDGLLCPFGYRFTEKPDFSVNHNDMENYGRYHSFWPTGISFSVIDHFV